MDARTLKLICTCSKAGDSLSQISEQTGLTIDEVKETLRQATGLSPEALSFIFHMKETRLNLEQISQDFGVELEVLKQFLPEVIKETAEPQIDALANQGKGPYEISLGVSERPVIAHTLSSPDDCKTYSRLPPTLTEETKRPHKPQPTKSLPNPQPSVIPTFFYHCKSYTNILLKTRLLTGEQFSHRVPGYEFKDSCRWDELHGGSLLLTGGGFTALREVVRIDTLREWAVSSQPPMPTARHGHASVYHSQYLYVLGGYSDRHLSECERFVCADSRWEVLPALPVACCAMSAVVINSSLYAIGGYLHPTNLDTVQKLSLDSLTWELMQLKLPQAASDFPCFKIDTQVYLVIKITLYSFTPLEVKPIKPAPHVRLCHTSYYSQSTLYYSNHAGINSLHVGELTNL
jgi:hypothetical protein